MSSRLPNNKHELYCYARVYHQMPKLDAVEFAGYARFAMNYKRVEDTPGVLERIAYMKKTPKAEIYADEEGLTPESIDPGSTGEVEQAFHWLFLELKENLRLAREAGKIRDANEAVKLMGGLIELERSRHIENTKIARERANKLGIAFDVTPRHSFEIPQNAEGVAGMGGRTGGSPEEGPDITVEAPGDIDEPDSDK